MTAVFLLSAKAMIRLVNFHNSWCARFTTVIYDFVEKCLLNIIHHFLFTNMEVVTGKIAGSRCQSAKKCWVGQLRV